MARSAEAAEPLGMPINIRHLAGGAEAGLAQVIVTWAQRNPEGQLHTFLGTQTQLADFVRRLPGLVAALCPNKAISTKTGASITQGLRTAALSRLDLLQGGRPRAAYRGSSAEIVCADHLGKDAPYLLYVQDPRGGSRLRSRENFRDLARWLIEGAVPQAYRPLFDSEASEAVGGMLFEIFKNTEDHARVDAAGNLLRVSIRAIKTNHHAISPDALKSIVEEFPPLAAYCETLSPPVGAAQTHLFELSVLDSGPGFAVTRRDCPLADLDPDDEEMAVRECFGSATAKTHGRFGEGLPHVIRLLQRQKGFLRLRTGRMSFFADFSGEMPTAEVSGPDLLQRYRPADVAELAPVAGSLLTILLPMRR